MDEFGFLQSPADKFGQLDGERLRAARIVIDIGIHLGYEVPTAWESLYGSGVWDYQKAERFLARNVAMNQGFRKFELDRYVGWGGQAIAYKVGQREWLNLRENALKSGLTIKDFHSKALSLGCLTFDLLKRAVL
jgi:uncharacterized protein (DUF885 family)